VKLARAVDAAILSGEHLLAEAPTGIGKSVAYLIPAIVHTTGENPARNRVVIATANIALQEQLIKKDLPMLSKIMPNPFSFALAKGRANYLCLDRLRTFDPDDVNPRLRVEAHDVAEWAALTSSGDKSDLPFQPQGALWAELSVTSDACRGRKCRHHEECFANTAKKEANASHIVVANYHLLFADMSVRSTTEGSVGVLPNYDVAVLDEGHRAADIARDFFGSTVSEWSMKRLVHDTLRVFKEAGRPPDPDVSRVFMELEETGERWFADAGAYKRSKAYQVRLRKPGEVQPHTMQLALDRTAKELVKLGDDGDFDGAQRATLRVLGARAREHIATLDAAAQLPDDDTVYFLEGIGRSDRVAVSCKPIDVSDTLRKRLFAEVKSVSVVSATLRVNNSFDHIAADLGVDAVNELMVPTPFDLRNQSLLICPPMSPPNDPAFREEVGERVVEAVELAGGRTLCLFTSYKNLEIAYDALMRARLSHPHFTRMPLRIMKQGEAPRMHLVDEFKRDIDSVLLGTDSFWEGIDVPGEALSCVVIDRLPFITPEDPVLDVIASRDPRGWFHRWSLPRAVIAFRQGFGRGVRTATDRCVVVLLDRRVVDKSYGRQFLRPLGPVHITRALAEVRAFLNDEGGQDE
jgi:ATP-dependent DNA helicase DinG